jgi:mannose-1-phosphate guanylyltransferase/mannose-6-phosphate isomerase
VLLILPADHVIRDVHAFQAAVAIGRKAADEGKLVTFGVVPTKPETGYGYIRRTPGAASGNAFPIAQFVEKPDRATAQRYVESGEYFWNSGMFMFRASTVLEEVRKLAPAIYEACAQAYTAAKRDLDFTRLPAKEFGACPSDSFDYAVMEKTQHGVVVPLDAGWSDVARGLRCTKRSPATRAATCSSATCSRSMQRGCYLQSTSRLVAAVGARRSRRR